MLIPTQRLAVSIETPVEDLDWTSVFYEEPTRSYESHPKKRFVCGFKGCSKSYSSRQNRHRHRINEHSTQSMITSAKKTGTSLQREKDILLETFSSICEKYGEKEAASFIMGNEKISEHLVSFRKIIDEEISVRLAEARESQACLELQLMEFKKSIQNEASDEMVVFRAFANIARKSTSDSIDFIKKFSKVTLLMVDHIENHSEGVNPKSCALKNGLDEMFTKKIDFWDIDSSHVLNGKRRGTGLDDVSIVAIPCSSSDDSDCAEVYGSSTVSSSPVQEERKRMKMDSGFSVSYDEVESESDHHGGGCEDVGY